LAENAKSKDTKERVANGGGEHNKKTTAFPDPVFERGSKGGLQKGTNCSGICLKRRKGTRRKWKKKKPKRVQKGLRAPFKVREKGERNEEKVLGEVAEVSLEKLKTATVKIGSGGEKKRPKRHRREWSNCLGEPHRKTKKEEEEVEKGG